MMRESRLFYWFFTLCPTLRGNISTINVRFIEQAESLGRVSLKSLILLISLFVLSGCAEMLRQYECDQRAGNRPDSAQRKAACSHPLPPEDHHNPDKDFWADDDDSGQTP